MSTLVGGFDFVAAPRLSPDGSKLAWICWNHPNMPWDDVELWAADVASDGSIQASRKVSTGHILASKAHDSYMWIGEYFSILFVEDLCKHALGRH